MGVRVQGSPEFQAIYKKNKFSVTNDANIALSPAQKNLQVITVQNYLC